MKKNENLLKCYHPNSNSVLSLFCFPHAGGAAQAFYKWSQELPPQIEVFSVQLPGRWERMQEQPFKRMAPLVTDVVDAMIPLLEKPFAFFGHSMGALIAFESALELRRRKLKEPNHLFVSGRNAPQLQKKSNSFHDMSDSTFIRIMRDEYDGIPKEILREPELLKLLVPALRADMEVLGTYMYSPGSRLSCSISAYGGLEDPGVSKEGLEAWKELTTSSLFVQLFSGGHFYISTSSKDFFRYFSGELNWLLASL